MILGDIELAAAYLIYLACGCRYAMPTPSSLFYYFDIVGEPVPHGIGWVLYLIGAFLFAFDASRTVCITSEAVSIGYLGGIVSRQYRWNEILYWGRWQTSLQKTQYVYLSSRKPKHRLSFESMKQCHLPYSKELFDLIYLLKNGDLSLPVQPERMTEEALRKKRRTYYAIRLIGTGISVLFSLIVMFSDSQAFVLAMGFVGVVVYIFYVDASETVLGKLEAELYNDFIAYQLSQ